MPKGKADAILSEASSEIDACSSLGELEKLRIKYLGRKSALISILKSLKEYSPEERRQIGQEANSAKKDVESLLAEAKQRLAEEKPETKSTFDYTLPGKKYPTGKLHLITQTINDLVDIFYGMGFEVAVGPEVESEYYNFDCLNFPADHPARDMQDTFYVSSGAVLRTHTSPIQVREFEKRKPPVKIIAPGRSYRQEAISARAYCTFYQLEGFYVDYNVTFADLIGVLTAFAHLYFGDDVKLRFRPSFFPFTEPSSEVDISCILCNGKGCRICKYEGWLEILGCGMIDPNVFAAVNYDPEEYTGYAFGMGIERIAMLKHKIDDIRLFYENDIRFLNQF